MIRPDVDRARSRPQAKKPASFLIECERAGFGQLKLELRARPGTASAAGEFKTSATAVMLRSPHAAQSAGARPPIAWTVMQVWEASPPAGVEALE